MCPVRCTNIFAGSIDLKSGLKRSGDSAEKKAGCGDRQAWRSSRQSKGRSRRSIVGVRLRRRGGDCRGTCRALQGSEGGFFHASMKQTSTSFASASRQCVIWRRYTRVPIEQCAQIAKQMKKCSRRSASGTTGRNLATRRAATIQEQRAGRNCWTRSLPKPSKRRCRRCI